MKEEEEVRGKVDSRSHFAHLVGMIVFAELVFHRLEDLIAGKAKPQ